MIAYLVLVYDVQATLREPSQTTLKNVDRGFPGRKVDQNELVWCSQLHYFERTARPKMG
jgi:hypothetical protein